MNLAAICGFCDDLVTPDNVHEHFNLAHPGEDWKLRLEPGGWPQYIEIPRWIEDDE